MRIACVLLAAGGGARFGGNKLLFPVAGLPLACHAIRLHGKLPYERRALVTRSSQKELTEEGKQCGFLIRQNPQPEAGIASSLRIGLSALLDEGEMPDGVLFGVCDQPYLTEETVRALLAEFARLPQGIVALSAGGRRGNPVIFAKDYFAELLALSGDLGGAQVIKRHPEALRLIPCPEKELTDIDTKDGIDALC